MQGAPTGQIETANSWLLRACYSTHRSLLAAQRLLSVVYVSDMRIGAATCDFTYHRRYFEYESQYSCAAIDFHISMTSQIPRTVSLERCPLAED
jgi:hypothetical protein